MFVIELVYTADLTEIDAHMAAHVAFLKKYYASGHFLVSGRKIPRDGGIILAVGENREQIRRSSRKTRSIGTAWPRFASSSSARANVPTTFKNRINRSRPRTPRIR